MANIGRERERMQVAERMNPAVPPPSEIAGEDSDGWCLIDKVGTWDSFLCLFQVLEEVPSQHKGAWTWAFSSVLERIQSADSPLELDRALMWLCFLPQALLRQGKRGGRLAEISRLRDLKTWWRGKPDRPWKQT